MAKLTVKAGSTSRLEHVFILDSTSTIGAGKTGLTNASVTAFYFRPGDTSTTGRSITLSAGTLGTWSSGGFKEVSATDMPGLYEIGIPNAIFASTVNHAVVMIKGTGIAPVLLEYDLVAYDPLDNVRLGLTALPNAVAGTVGGLPTGNASGEVTVGSLATTAQTNTAAAVWNALLASYTTSNSFGARIVRTRSTSASNEAFITGSNHIAADVHEMQAGVIVAADFAAGAIDANALNATALAAIADYMLLRKLDRTGQGTGSTANERTVLSALRYLRNAVDISASTMTIMTEDDTTTAWTATLSSTAGLNPVTGIDPA